MTTVILNGKLMKKQKIATQIDALIKKNEIY